MQSSSMCMSGQPSPYPKRSPVQESSLNNADLDNRGSPNAMKHHHSFLGLQSPLCAADFSATSRMASVDSASAALADPSASKGVSPKHMRLCLAGVSSLQLQPNESVVSTGTTAYRIGDSRTILSNQLGGGSTTGHHHNELRLSLVGSPHC